MGAGGQGEGGVWKLEEGESGFQDKHQTCIGRCMPSRSSQPVYMHKLGLCMLRPAAVHAVHSLCSISELCCTVLALRVTDFQPFQCFP